MKVIANKGKKNAPIKRKVTKVIKKSNKRKVSVSTQVGLEHEARMKLIQ
jgi:hypothetical protein